MDFRLYGTTFLLLAIMASAQLCPGASAQEKDVEGSSDHPMVSRYEGSAIESYDLEEFGDYNLFVGKAIYDPYPKTSAEEVKPLEGKITRITYLNPGDRSTLEIFRNYEQELAGEGFEILFSCSDEDCGGRAMNHAMTPDKMSVSMSENYSDQRYLAAGLSRAEGDVYVSLYVTKNVSGGGETKDRVFTQLDVVEIAPMEIKMVKAEEMESEISEQGRVAIYGILFDFDSADIKPGSGAVIAEIAKLLSDEPGLRIYVVGHTDNQGTLEYNIDLSERRAGAVVSDLVSNHGIEPSRLTPKGLGFLAPVATNRTEEGRAKNRRVELVPQ